MKIKYKQCYCVINLIYSRNPEKKKSKICMGPLKTIGNPDFLEALSWTIEKEVGSSGLLLKNFFRDQKLL